MEEVRCVGIGYNFIQTKLLNESMKHANLFRPLHHIASNP